MDWLRNLNIGRKLLLAFGSVVVLTIILGLFAWRGLSALNDASGELSNRWLSNVQTANEMRSLASDYRQQGFRRLMRASDQVKEDATRRTAEGTLE